MNLGTLHNNPIKISTAFADLAFVVDGSLVDLANEGSLITITRQTTNDGRVDVIQEIPFHVFLSLFTTGDDPAIMQAGKSMFIVSLGNGNFEFVAGEYITITLDGGTIPVSVVATEAPIVARSMYVIDRLVAQADSKKTKFNVEQFELMAFDRTHVKSIRVAFDNGKVIEYDADALAVVSRDLKYLDMLAPRPANSTEQVVHTGAVTTFSLVAVDQIEIEKTQGELVEFYALDNES